MYVIWKYECNLDVYIPIKTYSLDNMKPEKLKDEYQRILADSEQYLTFIHNYREQLVSMDMKVGMNVLNHIVCFY